MKFKIMYSLIFILPIFYTVSFSAILRVPADYSTIQDGVTAAQDGDTVLVADGTYTGDGNRDIEFFGKAITVKSENGPGHTTVACMGSAIDPHRGFSFVNGEGSGSVVQGFTISGGWAYDGGGIFCDWQSSPTIIDNIISGNSAYWSGGGISCYAASPRIERNSITGNESLWAGGGIYCNWYSNPAITDNEISGNNAYGGGGILCWFHSSPAVEGNSIARNETYYGAGIGCYKSSPVIMYNTITSNAAEVDGGGISCDESSPHIESNTLYGNSARWDGGGIICRNNSSPAVMNCVLWNDSAFFTDEIFLDGGSTIEITHCDVAGNWPGAGNMTADPFFSGPDNDEFTLQPDSPCIDAGHPGSQVPANGGDRIDMGACEYLYPDNTPLFLSFDNTPTAGCPGDTVSWDFTLENISDEYILFDGWIAVSGPAVSVRDSLLSLMVPPNSLFPGIVYVYIPLQASPGVYTVKGFVGRIHQ